MNGNVLPVGWAQTELENCVEILDSQRIPVNNKERQERIFGKAEKELYPYYGATGQVGKIDGYIFDEELVALGEDGVPFLEVGKGKAYILIGKTWVNNHAHVLRAVKGVIVSSYLLHCLNSIDYHGYVNGGTRLKLTQRNMRRLPVVMAPYHEQVELCHRVDELIAQVNNLKTRLEAIPVILKRFRQSVLAAAVSSKLTEDWRTAYRLPEWEKMLLGSLVEKPKYGSSSKSQKEGDVPVLRMGNLQGGEIDWNDLVYTTDTKEIEKYRLHNGDVLFNRTNSPELVGKTSIYRGDRESIYAGYLILLRCQERLHPEFLNYHLNSPIAKHYCKQVKSDGVSQSNINAKKLAAYPLSLPSLEEQEEIVRRVDELFAFADQVEKQVENAQARVNKLTPSILAKAFRGELTADWRAENPDLISGEHSAEALLARIKAEKEKLKPAKSRRGRKSESASLSC